VCSESALQCELLPPQSGMILDPEQQILTATELVEIQ
jgi:hypothetical protein